MLQQSTPKTQQSSNQKQDAGATMESNNIQQEIENIDLAPAKLSVDKLDSMMDFITEKQNLGWIGSIIQAVKLLCVVAYIIARNVLVQNVIADKKKKLEQLIRQRQQNQNEV